MTSSASCTRSSTSAGRRTKRRAWRASIGRARAHTASSAAASPRWARITRRSSSESGGIAQIMQRGVAEVTHLVDVLPPLAGGLVLEERLGGRPRLLQRPPLHDVDPRPVLVLGE